MPIKRASIGSRGVLVKLKFMANLLGVVTRLGVERVRGGADGLCGIHSAEQILCRNFC